MRTTTLRKVGGSVIPKVGIAVKSGSLIVHPIRRPRYTLDDLLAQCHPKVRRNQKDCEWLDARPVGREWI
jgi:antitoxin ChpS